MAVKEVKRPGPGSFPCCEKESKIGDLKTSVSAGGGGVRDRDGGRPALG